MCHVVCTFTCSLENDSELPPYSHTVITPIVDATECVGRGSDNSLWFDQHQHQLLPRTASVFMWPWARILRCWWETLPSGNHQNTQVWWSMLTSCRLSFSLLFLARKTGALSCCRCPKLQRDSLPTCRYIHRTYNVSMWASDKYHTGSNVYWRIAR
jgi:hypothetical protein